MADNTGNTNDTVARRVQRKLRESFGEDITVGGSDDAIYLSGRVRSGAERQLAEEIARSMAEGMGIENDLVVERLLPDDRIAVRSPDLGEGDLFQEFSCEAESDGLVNPEFTGQPLDSNPDADAGVADNPSLEDDPTYFPPTDPVIAPANDENREIQGGFAPTSMDDMRVERSSEDNLPGDEALADAARQALSDDATTTALGLDVIVERGVAHVRGRVPDLVDAENAEGVVSEVPGIRAVLDETTVEHM